MGFLPAAMRAPLEQSKAEARRERKRARGRFLLRRPHCGVAPVAAWPADKNLTKFRFFFAAPCGAYEKCGSVKVGKG
jgi:hypothetical protein